MHDYIYGKNYLRKGVINMNFRIISYMTQTVLLAVLICIPLSAMAQIGDEGREGRGMMGGGGMGMHEMMGKHGMGMDGGMMQMMKGISSLDLTVDQKKQLQHLRLQHQKEAIPLFARIRLAGLELDELLLAEPINMEKVRAKIREKHDAIADLDLSHLLLMQQLKSLLTPEQRQHLESMMMEMGPGMGHQPGMERERRDSRHGSDMPDGSTPKSDEPHGR